MRRTRSPCCARVTTGHTTAPPSRVMNARRLIASPEAQTGHRSNSHAYSGRGLTGDRSDVCFGSIADIRIATRHVRFTADNDRKSGHSTYSFCQSSKLHLLAIASATRDEIRVLTQFA